MSSTMNLMKMIYDKKIFVSVGNNSTKSQQLIKPAEESVVKSTGCLKERDWVNSNIESDSSVKISLLSPTFNDLCWKINVNLLLFCVETEGK